MKPGEVAEKQRRLGGDRRLLVGEPGVGAALAVGVKPGGEAAELGGDVGIPVRVGGVLLVAGELEQLAPQDATRAARSPVSRADVVDPLDAALEQGAILPGELALVGVAAGIPDQQGVEGEEEADLLRARPWPGSGTSQGQSTASWRSAPKWSFSAPGTRSTRAS